MDHMSVAANVAGVAMNGLQLSESLYELVTTFQEIRKEISGVANGVSILSMVLEELGKVLRRDYRVYRKQLLRVACKIMGGCESVFKEIQSHIGVQATDVGLSLQAREGVAWYFEGEGVKALQARLESLRSTLNVLLHVVQLAKVADAAQSYQGYPGTAATRDNIQRQKRTLIGFVIGNSQDILHLEELEEEIARHKSDDDVVGKVGLHDERKLETVGENAHFDAPEIVSPTLGKERSMSTSHTDGRQNPESKEGTHGFYSRVISKTEAAGSRVHVLTSSGEYFGTSHFCDENPPDKTPSAQWFLEVVPHARKVITIGPKSVHNETTSLRMRAEDTAKTLLLTWTDVDLDSITGGKGSKSQNCFDDSQQHFLPPNPQSPAPLPLPLQNQQPPFHPPLTWPPQHQQPQVLGTYPSLYGQQQVYGHDAPFDSSYSYPQYPNVFPLYHPGPRTYQHRLQHPSPIIPRPEDFKSSTADTDLVASARSTIPPTVATTPSASGIADDERANRIEANIDRQNSEILVNHKREHEETGVGQQSALSVESQKDKSADPKSKKKDEAIILTDCIGRVYILPFAVCSTWEGLENTIKEAFLHVHDLNPLINAGYYDIAAPTGEIVLKSCWETVVQPGWKITMQMWPRSEADKTKLCSDIKGSDSSNADKSNLVAAPLPAMSTPPHTQNSDEQTESRSGDQTRSADDDHDDDTDEDQVERAMWDGNLKHLQDRYVTNENMLLKQKRAKISVDVKLERNRRLVQLRQQLAQQEATLRAWQDCSDEAEQDAHLSWLEKQAAHQKAELDALSPPLSPPPPLSPSDPAKGVSPSKSDPGVPQKGSIRARLFGRGSFRSARSKDSAEGKQVPGVDENASVLISRLQLADEAKTAGGLSD